jgi:FKBP-type peptidyl-prolyl cis-trans isomerase FklB
MNYSMKQALLTVLAMGAATVLLRADDKPDLNTPKAKFSYAVGEDTGNRLRTEKIDVDIDLIIRGLKDSLAGNPALDEKALREVFQTVLTEHRKKMAEQNKQEGEKFLAENKTKPGVVTLPSGLQYKVLSEGNGPSPATNDLVTVQYRGTLIDGTEFDSSYKRGQPAEMSLNRTVKGWQQALPLMKAGSKWQLFVPSELAYGAGRSGQYILPNSALIFEVELVSSKPPPPPAAPAAAPAAATPREPVTSDIIKVPSKEEMEKGAKIEVIKKEDVEKLQKEQQQKKDAEKK